MQHIPENGNRIIHIRSGDARICYPVHEILHNRIHDLRPSVVFPEYFRRSWTGWKIAFPRYIPQAHTPHSARVYSLINIARSDRSLPCRIHFGCHFSTHDIHDFHDNIAWNSEAWSTQTIVFPCTAYRIIIRYLYAGIQIIWGNEEDNRILRAHSAQGS